MWKEALEVLFFLNLDIDYYVKSKHVQANVSGLASCTLKELTCMQCPFLQVSIWCETPEVENLTFIFILKNTL